MPKNHPRDKLCHPPSQPRNREVASGCLERIHARRPSVVAEGFLRHGITAPHRLRSETGWTAFEDGGDGQRSRLGKRHRGRCAERNYDVGVHRAAVRRSGHVASPSGVLRSGQIGHGHGGDRFDVRLPGRSKRHRRRLAHAFRRWLQGLDRTETVARQPCPTKQKARCRSRERLTAGGDCWNREVTLFFPAPGVGDLHRFHFCHRGLRNTRSPAWSLSVIFRTSRRLFASSPASFF